MAKRTLTRCLRCRAGSEFIRGRKCLRCGAGGEWLSNEVESDVLKRKTLGQIACEAAGWRWSKQTKESRAKFEGVGAAVEREVLRRLRNRQWDDAIKAGKVKVKKLKV